MGELYNKDNFWTLSQADWKRCAEPQRPADRVSESGSRYWFDEEGVTRGADHWGKKVGTCSWTLEGQGGREECCARVSWGELSCREMPALVLDPLDMLDYGTTCPGLEPTAAGFDGQRGTRFQAYEIAPSMIDGNKLTIAGTETPISYFNKKGLKVYPEPAAYGLSEAWSRATRNFKEERGDGSAVRAHLYLPGDPIAIDGKGDPLPCGELARAAQAWHFEALGGEPLVALYERASAEGDWEHAGTHPLSLLPPIAGDAAQEAEVEWEKWQGEHPGWESEIARGEVGAEARDIIAGEPRSQDVPEL